MIEQVELEDTNEPIFIKDGELFISNDKIKVKFLKEIEKLQKHCVKKASNLERLMNNKVKVEINLSFKESQQGGELNGNL